MITDADRQAADKYVTSDECDVMALHSAHKATFLAGVEYARAQVVLNLAPEKIDEIIDKTLKEDPWKISEERTNQDVTPLLEALEYIANARFKKCQETGCSCTYDTAHIALSKWKSLK